MCECRVRMDAQERPRFEPTYDSLALNVGRFKRQRRGTDDGLSSGNDPACTGLPPGCRGRRTARRRSEEHTSELQSLMRISYAVFCLKKKTTITIIMIQCISQKSRNKLVKTSYKLCIDTIGSATTYL